MLEVGKEYTFTWADGDGEEYEYGFVTAVEGTVVSVKMNDGKVSVINMATPKFIRADLRPEF